MFFPWKFFQRLLIGQVILYIVSVAAVAIFFALVKPEIYEEAPLILLQVSIALLIVVLLTSSWFAFRLAQQFGRVVLKARRISSKKFARSYSGDDQAELYEEEIGEFSELERALSKIRRKLKRRKDLLASEQEETEALMSSIGDAVVRVDMDEQITFFNSQFASRFMETEEIAQLPLLAHVFREPEVLESFAQALQVGERREVTALRIYPSDKEEKFYSLTVNPLINRKSKEVYGALGTFHDITELKRAELIRIEFVANASHELRTPLTSLKGYVDTLAEDIEKKQFESAHRFIEIVSRNVNRLMELVNDLLTVSSLESQKEIKKEESHPQQMSEPIIKQLVGQAEERGIRIHCDYQTDVVFGEPRKIEQVLINLVTNAIKYIGSEKQIEILWKKGKEGSTELQVKDNGPGISKEHLPRLFERFYRIDRGRSREAGGTGLGLAIVKHIMYAHGGQVRVNSRIGEGTEFVCTFPPKK